MALKGLALHLTLVVRRAGGGDAVVVDLPGAVWILALGPIPTSVVSFARLYGYSPRTAATGLALCVAARDRAAANFAHARRAEYG